MGGKTSDKPVLLTDEARRAKLDALLGHRLSQRGNVFLPTTAQYNALTTPSGLTDFGVALCRWTGLKPSGLTFVYEDLGADYSVNTADKTIRINQEYQTHPYSAGGIVTLAVMAYLIEYFDHAIPDRSFIEFSTIDCGLGLVILNGLRPTLSRHQRLYHILQSHWFHNDGLALTNYSHAQYAQAIVSYAHENRVPSESYTQHILARCQYLLPAFITNKTMLYLPEATISLHHKRAARLLWVKIITIALIVGAGTAIGIYIATQQEQPSTNNTSRISELEAVLSQKRAYEECITEASQQLSTYDPNDLFLNRQVDATKARCESLRNEYNFSLDQYNLRNQP